MNNDEMEVLETGDITISAGSQLVEDNIQHFVWGYYLCIENNSDKKISLVGKNWNITDEKGNSFWDNSEGFSGEIPEIEPGEYFEFSSLAPLSASNAVFYGSCKIKKAGEKLVEEIKIPTFTFSALKAPKVIN